MTYMRRISWLAGALAAAGLMSAMAQDAPAIVEAPVQAPGGDRTHYVDPALAQFPFSAAVLVGDTIYLAGEIGVVKPELTLAPGGVAAETRQIFRNIEATLKAMDADLSDLVKCTVFLDDMSKFGEMNAVYSEVLPDPKPARSTFGVDGLALGAALEIECLAIRRPR